MSESSGERRNDVRRRIERETLKAGGLAELAAQIAGVGYWRFDVAGGSVVWSDLIYDMYGLDRQDGPPDLEMVIGAFHPQDEAGLRAAIRHALATGEGYSLDSRLVRPNGDIRQVVGQGVCECDGDGRVTGLYGTLMDVTEQRRVDAEVRRNEALYRLLAENATDVISRIDLEGETLYVTPSALEVMGYSDAELTGRKTLEFVHREDGAALVAGFRRVMTGSAPERIEYRYQHRDGHWIWLEACPMLVRDEDGAPKEFIDVAREITARKALEAELVASRQAAEAAAEAKARFLANMSHELRTPITAVLGFTELLGSRCTLDENARRYVDRIASGGRALLATVNDVLDFSKLEAGQVRIAIAPMEPAAVTTETLDLFEAQAAAKGVGLDFRQGAPMPAWVMGDADRLRQVLLNLIGNAVKFTEAGGVTVEAGHDPKSGIATFAVTDTGPGIPPDRMAQLFQRFSQVDGSSTRRHHGTGLGLAICKGLVEAMGGCIGVEAAAGGGSRFWFTLPLAACEAPETMAGVDAPLAATAARVLVADDNGVNRELVRAILTPFEVVLVEAADGHEAIAAARGQAFDVILMDIRMPGCDGREAARTIRAEAGANQRTPIIAFTADGDQEAVEGDAALFTGRLGKPLKPADLIQAISGAAEGPGAPLEGEDGHWSGSDKELRRFAEKQR